MSQLETLLEPVPFYDLGATHREIRSDLDRAWRETCNGMRFVGGPAVQTFETEWARYCGVAHAVGVGNGTDALLLALRALGVGRGDEVVVPANTFVATVEAVVLAGASPKFVDVDPETLLIDAAAISDAVGPRTAAVIAVHLYGQVADMDAVGAVAERHGLALIEDAAQAHGATWQGRRAGSFGHIGCFSFYPGKNLGAFGDAGAVVTDDEVLADTVRSLSDHGRALGSHHDHPLLGVNSRLDALQAAVLSVKLAHLDGWNAARRAAVAAYRERLAGLPVVPVSVAAGATSACHLNVIRVSSRPRVAAALGRLFVGTGVHYPIPCHRQAPFVQYADQALPVVERAAQEVLSLPLFPHITDAQIDRVCAALRDSLRRSA